LLAQGKRGGCMGGERDEKSILSEAEGSPLLGTFGDWQPIGSPRGRARRAD